MRNKLIKSLENNQLIIRDKNSLEIAYLTIVGIADLNDIEFIEKVTEWRTKYSNCFLSVFIPNNNRTINWLRDTLLPDQERIFCKIYTTEKKLLGHIGAIIHTNYVELDYIIRGEKVDINDFSFAVTKRFLKWVCDVTGIKIIKARIRSDNIQMINFVSRMGFKISEILPLRKENISSSGYNLIVDTSLATSLIKLIVVEMKAEALEI